LLITIGASLPSTNPFPGPVLVISGLNDVPICGGDCTNGGAGRVGAVIDTAKQALPNANPFVALVEPETGHGFKVHYTAANVYAKIMQFWGQNGLAA
jgi:hypothetical protein